MTLTFLDDTADAAWLLALTGGPTSIETTLWLGPNGFDAYARVLELPDPAHDRQPEAEISDDVLDSAPSDVELLTRIVEVLGSPTEDLRLLLWEGYPYRPALSASPRLDLAGVRRYALAAGSVDDWARWVDDAADPHGRAFPPAFMWPADRRWCIAFDVDAHFAGVGASTEDVARLLTADGTTAVPATHGSTPLLYG